MADVNQVNNVATLWIGEQVRHWDEFMACLGQRVERAIFKENAR